MKIIVTTSLKEPALDKEGQAILAASSFPFVLRQNRSLSKLKEEYEADGIIVWRPQGPVLHVNQEEIFFHPGMGYQRLIAYRNHKRDDALVKVCKFQPEDSFLDCTLGLGADAIVASYFLSAGKVTGLEASPAIAMVVKWGMQVYNSKYEWLSEAVKRVQVNHENHLDYLKTLPDHSIDIIYFDPMFRAPLQDSTAMLLLRSVADTDPLSHEAIEEAVRVAKKRVVMKERNNSGEFQRLGFKKLEHSRSSPVDFGVIEI